MQLLFKNSQYSRAAFITLKHLGCEYFSIFGIIEEQVRLAMQVVVLYSKLNNMCVLAGIHTDVRTYF